MGTAVALLVGSKVFVSPLESKLFKLKLFQVLNVQVPFYFKSVVDSMNVDFVALGGTAWTVGGAMIVACMEILQSVKHMADMLSQTERPA